MSETNSPDEPATGETARAEAAKSAEVRRIEADLEATRERLAGTVDALGAKLDVKTRTQEKVVQVRNEHGTQVAIAAGTLAALVVVLVVWRRRR